MKESKSEAIARKTREFLEKGNKVQLVHKSKTAYKDKQIPFMEGKYRNER